MLSLRTVRPMLYRKLSRLVDKENFRHSISSNFQNADPFENQPQLHIVATAGAPTPTHARTHARTQHRHFVKSSFNAIKQSFFPHYISLACFGNLYYSYVVYCVCVYHVGFCR